MCKTEYNLKAIMYPAYGTYRVHSMIRNETQLTGIHVNELAACDDTTLSGTQSLTSLKRLNTLGGLEISIRHQMVNTLELSVPPPQKKKINKWIKKTIR